MTNERRTQGNNAKCLNMRRELTGLFFQTCWSERPQIHRCPAVQLQRSTCQNSTYHPEKKRLNYLYIHMWIFTASFPSVMPCCERTNDQKSISVTSNFSMVSNLIWKHAEARCTGVNINPLLPLGGIKALTEFWAHQAVCNQSRVDISFLGEWKFNRILSLS